MKEKLPEPEGVCPFCGKTIYIGLKEHMMICKLEKE